MERQKRIGTTLLGRIRAAIKTGSRLRSDGLANSSKARDPDNPRDEATDGRFWHGKNIPTLFQDPVFTPHLSFNGQLHFRCEGCREIIWADITFGKHLLQSESRFPCPNCRADQLEPAIFVAVESRLCRTCATQTFARPNDRFTCSLCGGRTFVHDATIIHPPYPSRLFVLIGHKKPLGVSSKEDIEFLMKYAAGLRMSPQFHQTCVHLTLFIESLFDYVYGGSHNAVDLLNAASGLMRTIYKETGDLDAAVAAITMMVRGRGATLDPVQRAVFGLNICQNVYSPLARRERELLSLRLGFDLKEYGVALARETLAAFEALNEPWLAELRARQKWLLGDILKADDPTEVEIQEALNWFDAALRDPGLKPELSGYVKESALSAQAKRENSSPEERSQVSVGLAEMENQNLETSTGSQRIISLYNLLRGRSRSDRDREEFALRCLGEALVYTAANDPRNMLRHMGTLLSRLVAGYAAERFDAGSPLEGIAGVEAFRSLAIRHGDVRATFGHHIHELEVRLLTDVLFANVREPISVATEMLSKHRSLLESDLLTLLQGRNDRIILWHEVWNGELIVAKVKLNHGRLDVQTHKFPFGDMAWSELPLAFDPPGRLRAQRVSRALAAGWDMLGALLNGEPRENTCLFVGPSILASWPIDAAEICGKDECLGPLRAVSYSPTLGVASAARRKTEGRTIDRVLIVSYGGNDLPGTMQEVENVRAVYRSRVSVLDGNRLVRTEVLRELSKDYDVIHFCGHGEFNYLDPMQSKLYFHDHERPDSFVTASDIVRCETIGRNPIVVLAACTSAAVLPNGANNFLGLSGAIIRTGATAIVGARWPISDSIGGAFSKIFHGELASGLSVYAATSKAKSALRSARIDEWSAFISIEG